MRGRRTNARRKGFAVLACVLWLLGVEVLPALHLARHDDHHTHAADGAIVSVARGSHRHDDGAVHADHDHDAEIDEHHHHDDHDEHFHEHGDHDVEIDEHAGEGAEVHEHGDHDGDTGEHADHHADVDH